MPTGCPRGVIGCDCGAAYCRGRQRLYSCDCCGRMVPREQIANVIAYGIETAACDRCRGAEELQRNTR